MARTTNEVLGTREGFMGRLRGNRDDSPLANASIAKYMQSKGLPRVGDTLRDVIVAALDGTTRLPLSSLLKPGRPLVLNFGSCS